MPELATRLVHCDLDEQVRCVESGSKIMSELDVLRDSIKEAEKEIDIAERHLKNKKLHLQTLRNQLQNALVAGVSAMKTSENVVEKKSAPPKDEATRKAEVRRRWRVLGLKIKFGLGAQAMAVKRRNLKDADSFIDKESEVS